ncbi:MAG: hypothetical protein CFE24_08955 [Flavobacterium sp. BFFFF2]|nr:MAG: hypothetical protein CFE24_08955 [Flavobacterium sp. BFFFF2]
MAVLFELSIEFLFHFDSNYWVIVYSVIETVLIGVYFSEILKKENAPIIKIYYLIFTVFFVSVHLLLDVKDRFIWDGYIFTFQTVSIFLFSTIWFIDLFSKLEESSLLKNPHFYFVCGLVLYYAGTETFFLLSDLLYKNHHKLFFDVYFINSFFIILQRIFFMLGLWRIQKNYTPFYG